jgi:hypothetical protein
MPARRAHLLLRGVLSLLLLLLLLLLVCVFLLLVALHLCLAPSSEQIR